MKFIRSATLALTGAVLLSSCQHLKITAQNHGAKIEESGREGIMRVTLEARAAERIGLETAKVLEEGSGSTTRSVVPYGAIMYDTKGDTWTFTNPEPLVFVRQRVVVQAIEGDRVILSEGPTPGTVVVTVGAAELMGVEHKYGQ